MNYTVFVRDSAEADIVVACDWYEERHAGLGGEFVATLDQLLGRLVEFPRSYPEVHRGVRRAVLPRFPYLVYFQIDESRVRVLAGVHASRSPAVHSAKFGTP